MKKLLSALLAVALILSLAAVASAETEAKDYKIAVVTGTMSQSIDERASAMMLMDKYGEDVVLTATYPDNFVEEKETTIQSIVQFADDPDVKVLFVSLSEPKPSVFLQIK